MTLELITLGVMILGGAVVGFAIRGIRTFLNTGDIREERGGKALEGQEQPQVEVERVPEKGDARTHKDIEPPQPAVEPPAFPQDPIRFEKSRQPEDGIWLAKIDPTLVMPKAGAQVLDALLTPPVSMPEASFFLKTKVILKCTKGEYVYQSIEIPEEGVMVGRDPAFAHLILHDGQISGRHCLFRIQEQMSTATLHIEDINSLNGTQIRFFGGGDHWEAVKGVREIPLSRVQGMEVQLAGGVCVFETQVASA